MKDSVDNPLKIGDVIFIDNRFLVLRRYTDMSLWGFAFKEYNVTSEAGVQRVISGTGKWYETCYRRGPMTCIKVTEDIMPTPEYKANYRDVVAHIIDYIEKNPK
jgi:hypothetical protein